MVAVARQGLVEMNTLIEEGQGTSLEGSPASGDEDKKAMGSGPGKWRLGGPVTMSGRHRAVCQPRYTFFVTLDVASMCFNSLGHLCVHLVPRWVRMPLSSHQGHT